MAGPPRDELALFDLFGKVASLNPWCSVKKKNGSSLKIVPLSPVSSSQKLAPGQVESVDLENEEGAVSKALRFSVQRFDPAEFSFQWSAGAGVVMVCKDACSVEAKGLYEDLDHAYSRRVGSDYPILERDLCRAVVPVFPQLSEIVLHIVHNCQWLLENQRLFPSFRALRLRSRFSGFFSRSHRVLLRTFSSRRSVPSWQRGRLCPYSFSLKSSITWK